MEWLSDFFKFRKPRIYRKIRSSAFDERVRFLILHSTVENFQSSIKSLTQNVSAHYLLPDFEAVDYQKAFRGKKQVFGLVKEGDRAWHAGASAWGDRVNLNDTSIGIEIVNEVSFEDGRFNFPVYPDAQIEYLVRLIRFILKRYPDITPTRILGHSDIAPTRKTDPGAKFPWKRLYDQNIGAWYELKTKQYYEDQFHSKGPPAAKAIQNNLRRYGYFLEPSGQFDETTKQVVRAFQLHFRSSNFDGVLDVETAAILYALMDQYFSV